MPKKLHELLAVENQLKDQAQKTRTDLRATFEKKRHLFEEKLTTFQPAEEGAEAVTEHQSDLQSTVRKELAWLAGIWTKALNVSLSVAETNTRAAGDIVLDDGVVLMKGVPATGLLELEKRVAELQELVAAVPTLDPVKGFAPDLARGEGVYRAREHVTVRTKKTQRPIVLYDATKEHPAQTQLIPEDVPVGKITVREWSGLITPAQKADMLERVETLRRAVKQARARANEAAVPDGRDVGKEIFGYVFGA